MYLYTYTIGLSQLHVNQVLSQHLDQVTSTSTVAFLCLLRWHNPSQIETGDQEKSQFAGTKQQTITLYLA